jgi:hypothetical protein
MESYKIVRMFFNNGEPSHRTITTGLSLEEAQEHCNDPETSSSTCTSSKMKAYTKLHGPWFDGYEEE